MNELIEMTEAEIRAMRDKIYDQTTSDGNWDACKDAWMKPDEIRWLKEIKPS